MGYSSPKVQWNVSNLDSGKHGFTLKPASPPLGKHPATLEEVGYSPQLGHCVTGRTLPPCGHTWATVQLVQV